MEVPGRFVDARQNGATARLVIDAVPQPIIPPPGEPVDDAVEDAGAEPLPRPHRAQEQPQRARRSGATSRRATAVTPPGAVLRPRRAGDPDRRPRPRHVLARPRRRDGRRAGRLRLDGQPLRRQPPLRARARARQRRARGPAHRDPPLRHLRPDEDGLPGDRHRARLHPQQLRALRVRRRPARGLDRGAAVGAAAPARERRAGDRAAPGRRAARPGRRRRRARRGRAHLRRALHGRARLRRHVPAGRPAVHARPRATRPRRRSSAS